MREEKSDVGALTPQPGEGVVRESGADPVLAIDLGGTKIAGALIDPAGHILLRKTVPSPAHEGAAAMMDAVLSLTDDLLREGGPARAIGVGAAGTIDPATGRVVYATSSISGWRGTDIGEPLRERIGLPVAVLNDVRVHALGEFSRGAGRGMASMLMVALGTGVGGALVVNSGQIMDGWSHRAGDVAHVPIPEAVGFLCGCGRYGHLEALASGPGLFAAYERAGGTRVGSAVGLNEAATQGDDIARSVLQLAGRGLGRALAGVRSVVDPQLIVVGGSVAQAGELWWAAVEEGFSEEVPEGIEVPGLVRAQLGPDAALFGAATLAENTVGGHHE